VELAPLSQGITACRRDSILITSAPNSASIAAPERSGDQRAELDHLVAVQREKNREVFMAEEGDL